MLVAPLTLGLLPLALLPIVLAEETTPSAYAECVSSLKEEKFSLAVGACQRAVIAADAKSERFAESLLHLAEAHERDGNPWLSMDTLRRVLATTDASGFQTRVCRSPAI